MLKYEAVFIYTDTFIAVFQETRILISPDCLVCGLVDWHLTCPFSAFQGDGQGVVGSQKGSPNQNGKWAVLCSLFPFCCSCGTKRDTAAALQGTSSHWCQVGFAVQHRVVEVIFLGGKAGTLGYTLASKSLTRKNGMKVKAFPEYFATETQMWCAEGVLGH